MNNNKLIAAALLDLAKNSKTEIIEVDSDFDLIEAAAKLNIQLPSPDLAVIKTVYAETDKPNRNGITLPKKDVEAGLPTIIGKQINWEHEGAGRICGYIIDAKLNKDLIEITGVIFKSLFPEEMDEVKVKFEKGELTVSFEIWNKDPKTGKSVVHDLSDGSRSISPIIFHGCGLLLAHAPACPKAKVYKLIAKVEKNIEEKVFDKDLVYASQALEETKCQNCKSCNCHKEETKVEEINKEIKIEVPAVEAKVEVPAVEVPAEEAKKVILCPECQEPLKDDENEICAVCKNKKIKAEETKVEEKPVETKTEEKSEVAETKTDAPKTEDKPAEAKVEEKPVEAKVEDKPAETPAENTPVETPAKEAAQVAETVAPIEKKVIAVINEEIVITHDSMDGKVVRNGLRKTTRKFDDNTEEVFQEEFAIVDTYTQAQLDEKVLAAKAEKDAEIATIKAAHDVELKNKDTELASKSQEIAALTVKEEPTPKDKVLEVGSVESKDKYAGIQAEVNAKAFGKK